MKIFIIIVAVGVCLLLLLPSKREVCLTQLKHYLKERGADFEFVHFTNCTTIVSHKSSKLRVELLFNSFFMDNPKYLSYKDTFLIV